MSATTQRANGRSGGALERRCQAKNRAGAPCRSPVVRSDEAVSAYSEALALYERKENLVGAGRVTRSLALLQTETTT